MLKKAFTVAYFMGIILYFINACVWVYYSYYAIPYTLYHSKQNNAYPELTKIYTVVMICMFVLVPVSMLVYAVFSVAVFKKRYLTGYLIVLVVWLQINTIVIRVIPPMSYAVSAYLLYFRVLSAANENHAHIISWSVAVSYYLALFIIFAFCFYYLLNNAFEKKNAPSAV